MGEEIIKVVVDGMAYRSWKSASIRAAMKEAARSFQLEVAAESGPDAQAWTFRAGAKVAIYANTDLLLTGYVDRYQPQLNATLASAVIAGRSKGADSIDSSAEHKTGRFEKKTPLDIARELDVHGVGWTSDQQLDQVPVFQLTPGETVFSAVERLAREQGMTLMGRPDGGIEITKAGSKRHAYGIFEGFNLKEGDADHNWSNRHSKYVVRGQKPHGSTAEDLEVEAIARDTGVDRNRTVIIVEEQDTSKPRAKKRAKNRRDRAVGNGLKASVTVQGFRDLAGEVWTPNRLVWLESVFLHVTQDMLIEAVTLTQDASGSITRLELVDPKAYGGRTKGQNKSGTQWKQDDSEAE